MRRSSETNNYPAAPVLSLLCVCGAFFCFFFALPAAAVSFAGEYLLADSVLDNGGGVLAAGGDYSVRGSVGQPLPPDAGGEVSSSGYYNRRGFYNPPHFTFQKGLPAMVSFNSGAASLLLPAGAVDKETFDITLNKDPMTEPDNVSPSVIFDANSKMEQNEGAWSRLFPSHITEMTLFDEQSLWTRPFSARGTLSMQYKDDNADDILDGSNPPVRVETVRAWALDEALAMWVKIPDPDRNAASKTISVPLSSPGVYSLLGMIDESVKDVYAFPVPFRPNGPAAGAGPGQAGTEADGITFANVPQTGDIEIYTLDGRLVRKLPIPQGLPLPKLKWDVRTSGGGRAASGVYIWRVVSGPNSKTGKLMVIW